MLQLVTAVQWQMCVMSNSLRRTSLGLQLQSPPLDYFGVCAQRHMYGGKYIKCLRFKASDGRWEMEEIYRVKSRAIKQVQITWQSGSAYRSALGPQSRYLDRGRIKAGAAHECGEFLPRLAQPLRSFAGNSTIHPPANQSERSLR